VRTLDPARERVPGHSRERVPGLDERLARRVAWLMLARILLLLVVLGVVVALEASEGVSGGERPVLGAVLTGLAATIGSGLVFRRFRSPRAFGALQVGTDLAVVTAIVHATGAGDSVFSFLYVLVVAYAALLFDRRLSVVAAFVASLFYAGSLLVSAQGWGPGGAWAAAVPRVVADAAVKAGALFVVAALASGLSRELARADRALDERTRDFGRLQNLHELTVQSLGSGLLTVDFGGVVRSYNREAEHITGLPLAEALGKPLAAVLPGAERLLAGRADGERRRERMPFTDATGEFLHLGLAASVLRDAEGRPSGHVIIFQDITGIVEMEQELRRSERMAAVGELAAGIAHEVRNPLASMSGSVQMLRAALSEDDAEQRRLMDIVLRETDRLDHLIGDFLLYARPKAPDPTSVDVAALAADLEDMVGSARPRGVTVHVDVPEGVRAWVDEDQLRQLLWNLLLNGAQAMEEGGGELRLEARRVSASDATAQDAAADGRNPEDVEGCASVEISVSDTGVGIEPERLERIFEPFFTTKPRGSGLGLAMVHRIVEANAGTLGVESEPGGGTRFRLCLPAGGDDGSVRAERTGAVTPEAERSAGVAVGAEGQG
jgi:two-component system sensor histidine kinase PilS (NtrC family)